MPLPPSCKDKEIAYYAHSLISLLIMFGCGQLTPIPPLTPLGMNLIDAGHFATENPVVAVLAEKIAAAFPGIQVKISETHRDCMKFY